MSTTTSAYLVLVSAVLAQRAAEVRLSRRHARILLAEGGIESGRRQLPLIMILHLGLLVGCVVEPLTADRRPRWSWLAVGVAVLGTTQLVRLWTMRALGPRWTARVIVLSGRDRIRSGPYRWLAHPNYLAVVVEGLALPLAGGATLTALAFTVINVPLLAVRIRTEERALASTPTTERSST